MCCAYIFEYAYLDTTYFKSIPVEPISLRRSLLKKSPIKETDLDTTYFKWNGIRGGVATNNSG